MNFSQQFIEIDSPNTFRFLLRNPLEIGIRSTMTCPVHICSGTKFTHLNEWNHQLIGFTIVIVIDEELTIFRFQELRQTL